MATVNLDKEAKVLILKCDCGAIHYIDLSQSKIQVKSEYKQEKEYKNAEKKERKSRTTIFDELFESESESDELDESEE